MTIKLRDYQVEAVNGVLNHVRKGERKLLIVLATGLGKALENMEPIMTNNGFVPISSLVVGDKVYGTDGELHNVLGVFPQGDRPSYKILFSDGTEIIADKNHLWSLQTRYDKNRKRGYRDFTTEGIIEYMNANKAELYLPDIKPISLPNSGNFIDSYVMGILLSEGHLTQDGVKYSTSDSEIVLHMNNWITGIGQSHKFVAKYDYRIGTVDGKHKNNYIRNELNSLGLIGTHSDTKFIPKKYLYDSYENRLELLRGLMDGDGYIMSGFNYCEYSTSSKQLAEDVMFLIKSLGGRTSIRSRIPKYLYKGEKKDGLLNYMVRVSIDVCPFNILRKKREWKIPKYSKKLKILSVEYIGNKECTCIQVDSQDKLFLARNLVPTHNTTVFSSIIGIVHGTGKKALVLAHRDELLTQAKERIELMNQSIKVGTEGGEFECDGSENVVVASVATLGRVGSKRIEKFNPEEFGIIVIDETHHCTSATYQNILKYFGVVEGSKKYPVILGVTATPNRADGEDLRTVFDHVVCNYDIRYGINNGYLANVKAYTVNTETDISEVGTSAGDFKIGELGLAVNTDERNSLIIATYKRLLEGKKAISFCVNVEHSKALSKAFSDAGIKSASVTGDTPQEERNKIMKDYKEGDLQVLCNCLVATEGFDAPETYGVLLARPTKSESLFIQMAGRGLRLAEGKDHVKLIDFVDNTKNNSIVTSSALIGLKKPIKINGENLFDYDEKFKQLLANNPFVDVSTVDLADIDSKIHEINIFDCIHTPDDIKAISKNSWHHYGTGYKISLGQQVETKQVPGTDIVQEVKVKMVAQIQENALGNFSIDFMELTEQTPHFKNGFSRWKKKVIFTEESPVKELALKKADELISEKYPEKINLIGQNARWKGRPASEKQIALLKKFGFAEADKLNMGEAGNLLTYYFDTKEANKPVGGKKVKKSVKK